MGSRGWRLLFAQDDFPNHSEWPFFLQPLKQAFEQLSNAADPVTLKRWQPTLVTALYQLDLPAWRISQVLSDHNDWIYRHLVKESLAEMMQQGWGGPPCRFCLLTLGSAARHESLLAPDQDNALIIDNYPPERHLEIDTWFQNFAERVTDKLNMAGIPLCKGHVMARWPLWRKPLNEWCEQMRLWTHTRRVKLVQLSNILLDFAPVYGDVKLADSFQQALLLLMPQAGLFLDEMNALQDETRVALDGFDRLVGDDQEAPHQDALNLKRQGLLPLQAALRLFCLRKGLMPNDCLGRIAALQKAGHIPVAKAQALREAFVLLMDLLLHAQMQSIALGRTPDGWIDRKQLSEGQLYQLKTALIEIRQVQKSAASD